MKNIETRNHRLYIRIFKLCFVIGLDDIGIDRNIKEINLKDQLKPFIPNIYWHSKHGKLIIRERVKTITAKEFKNVVTSVGIKKDIDKWNSIHNNES